MKKTLAILSGALVFLISVGILNGVCSFLFAFGGALLGITNKEIIEALAGVGSICALIIGIILTQYTYRKIIGKTIEKR